MTIRVRKLARLQIVALDACGRIPITGSVLIDSTTAMQEIGFDAKTQDTGEEIVVGVDGKTCSYTPATYSNAGDTISLLNCGISRHLEAAMGWVQKLHVTNGGWIEKDNDTEAQLAIFANFLVPTSNCAGGSTQTVIGKVWTATAWRKTGTRTINGKDMQNSNWTGETFRVPTRLFELFTVANTPSGEFAHWASFWSSYITGNPGWSVETDPVAAPVWGTEADAPRAVKTV
jgi:hypothetical protein